MKFLRLAGIISFFLLNFQVNDAMAARLVNLSGQTQEVIVESPGSETMIVLEPNASWHGYGYPLSFKVGSHSIDIELHSDYAIWKDGSIALQYYRRSGGSAL